MGPFTNQEVADLLTNIATAYEIKKKGRFRVVAYENAADSVLTNPENVYELWQKDPKLLEDVPNVGPSIFRKLDYLFRTGEQYPTVKRIFKNIHPAVFTLTKINGIGPINANKLTKALKFSKKDPLKAIDQLVKYAKTGKIRDLPTFGEKSEESILANTIAFLGRNARMPLNQAQELATNVIEFLQRKFPDVVFIPLGSLRRQSPTVGDIDIAAASNQPRAIINRFLNYPDAVQTIARGKNKASIRLIHDIHIDLMVKPPESFGALVQHFTGSRQHNIILRRYALEHGLSLSEYGIRDIKSGKLYLFANEEKFYDFLGFKYIPPSQRLGENELEIYKK